MYYIFNSDGFCMSSCETEPNQCDLVSRGEIAIEDVNYFDITQIRFVDGNIQGKRISSTNEIPEIEHSDASVSNEIMDIAEIVLDVSDTIRTLQRVGETA